ncbi:CASC3/Barentsz eIF4AIII binding-domain-containing protein [Podospora aff. communis PSN243]|uniref:CASC3/Barentsz eIF4AIII binding-domain-containing protein n=1 Tax=Podospora aff. communis PSN243 TaxID=3040156 RepID=A0AAV9H1A3_9PEZI|nr:CASC3/Barentsz eIF4AIII binding-domain-containing protein [Podospora aff. communis PSN243]
MAAAMPRRRKVIGHRRRVEDEGEEEGGPEALDLDDDSLTDGSIASDEHDQADDSDTSNVDEMSPTTPNAAKSMGNGNAKPGFRRKADSSTEKPAKHEAAVADNEIMLNRLSLADKDGDAQEVNFEDVQLESAPKGAAPIVVSSSPVSRQRERVPMQEQKRREHEEYRRKRAEDPTFVPNRGAFFLHDHRAAGPAANGFRPFPRGARGRGRGGFGGPFAPVSQMHNVSDPTTTGPWAHDMHEAVVEPPPPHHHHRQARYFPDNEGPLNGTGIVQTAPQSKTAINRAMSTERILGNVTVRVYIPPVLETPKTFSGIPLKQYTKLPDHRPPLRRDKPVRISIPEHAAPLMPRYIYPANDRSFIFIPRAMRPNQQRVRGKGPRSNMGGSVGPFSRRTSVYGSYYGSVYSPSIAMSRRSSIVHDFGRDYLLSPTGSAISRPPLPMDNSRPVVRLPPLAQPQGPSMGMPPPDVSDKAIAAMETSISDIPQPQTHPLPQKPIFQETRPNSIPMHQPRPQKTVSVENIESPVQAMNAPPPYQQAFHHQVPPQVSNPYGPETHVRHPSYHSQAGPGTPGPLSQIPERAIHAAPFQPNAYPQPGFYGQGYPMMQQPQQGFYYPQQFGASMAPNASAPAFVPAAQQNQPAPYNTGGQGDAQPTSTAGQAGSGQGLVMQEMGGTFYFYDPNQIPAMGALPSYPPGQQYNPGMVGMGGMVTPSPDGFYYQQPAPGMVYYAP